MLNGEQQELAEQHWKLVDVIVASYGRRAPRSASLECMRGDAALALCEAAQKYEPGTASFHTYASHRLRGAVVDGVRSRQYGGRGKPAKVHPDTVLDGVPSEAEELGADYMRRELVARLMTLLTRRQREVVDLLYFQHMTGVEAANRLKVTQGYVSRLHKSALARMRDAATEAA